MIKSIIQMVLDFALEPAATTSVIMLPISAAVLYWALGKNLKFTLIASIISILLLMLVMVAGYGLTIQIGTQYPLWGAFVVSSVVWVGLFRHATKNCSTAWILAVGFAILTYLVDSYLTPLILFE